MQLHPAKFVFDWDNELSVSDASHEIVDSLTRGICDVYFDRCGCPPDAIVMINEEEISSLQRELLKGDYSRNPELEKTIKAMLDFAEKNPATDGRYCFVCSDY